MLNSTDKKSFDDFRTMTSHYENITNLPAFGDNGNFTTVSSSDNASESPEVEYDNVLLRV